MPAGYSPNPLYKKLGLKEGLVVKLVNAPANYTELIGDAAESIVIKNKATTSVDFIHLFTNSLKELEKSCLY